MKISVSEAKGRLTDLVRRAEAGDEVILTRHGQAAVRLVPLSAPTATAEAKRAAIRDIQMAAARKLLPGPSAARSQDFLYEDGMP